MSHHNVPPFDLLEQDMSPYTGFGDPLPDSVDRFQRFNNLVQQAIDRTEEQFDTELSVPAQIPGALEAIIDQMWQDDWQSQAGDTNLFVTDFGLLLTDSIQKLIAGTLVFRSEADLSHVSLWWPTVKMEAFPFHAVYRRLTHEDGQSIETFAAGVVGMVRRR